MDIEIILEPDITPQQVAEIAVEAEKYGIRSLWTSNYHDGWDAFLSLVPAAQATSRIQLGPLAVSPFEMHPMKIAHSLLTLNELSNGRAMVGIGGGGSIAGAMEKGWWDHKKKRSVRAVREAIEIVRSMADGEFHRGYEGEIFSVTRPYHVKYSKAPAPKIYSCSTGPQMLRMGGKFADGIHMSDIEPEFIKPSIENVVIGLGRRELPVPDEGFRTSNFWAWHIKKDREASMVEARRELVWRSAMVPPFAHLTDYVTQEEADLIRDKWDAIAAAFWTRSGQIDENEVPRDLIERCIRHFSSAGDESNIDEQIERFQMFKDGGLNDLAIRLFDDPMESLKMIGEKVVPAFR